MRDQDQRRICNIINYFHIALSRGRTNCMLLVWSSHEIFILLFPNQVHYLSVHYSISFTTIATLKSAINIFTSLIINYNQ